MSERLATEAADEDAAMRRTTHVMAAVTSRLRVLGLYGVDSGSKEAAAITPESRRELLVFLSELEEAVKIMQSFADDLASNITQHNRRHSAAAAYIQTSVACRQYGRRRGH